MENEKLVELIQAGIDPRANMEQLYKQNRGFIWKMCARYQGVNEMDDLLQEAYIILDSAVQTYSPSRSLFISWLGYCITYQMPRRLLSQNLVRLPVEVHTNWMKCVSFKAKYNKQNGHDPSDQEIMDALNMSKSELERVYNAVSIINKRSLDEDIDSIEGISLGETIKDDTDLYESIDDEVDSELVMKVLREALFYLPDNQRNAIRLKIQGKSLDDISELLGYKNSHSTRQIVYRGIKQLRNHLIDNGTLQMLYEDAYKGSLSTFQRTFTSTPERIAINHTSQKICTAGA